MSPKINLLHGLSTGQSWVRVGLSLESASFTREHLRALERGTAEYLGLDPGAVKTLSVTAGSLRWSCSCRETAPDSWSSPPLLSPSAVRALLGGPHRD